MLLFLAALLGCTVFVTLLWIIGERLHNASIIDSAWSVLITASACFYAFRTPGLPVREVLMLTMVCLWGGRLALHIFLRLLHEKKEDARYTKLREKWGADHSRKMLKFFWQQAVAAAIFSIPFLVISSNPSGEIGAFEIAGFLIWIAALTGETAADRQLAAFKHDASNKGKVCRVGLWNLSRHPNYFFEWMIWVSVFVFALGSPYGWLTFIFPLGMFHVLRNVTGVPMAEKQSLASRGDLYRQYQSEVNAFFPGFPKRVNHGR